MKKKTYLNTLPKILRAILSAKFFYPILLVLALIIVSCGESDIIGLDVQPQADALIILSDDSTSFVTFSLKEDSVRTDQTIQNLVGRVSKYPNLLGSYHDPLFGQANASIYTQFLIPNNLTNVNFGNPSDLSLDSVVLSLAYQKDYFGSLENQTIKVFPLTEALSKDSIYYYSNTLMVESVEIANYSFIPRPTDSVLINEKNFKPHLRIRLDDAFGQWLLSASGSADLGDNTAFLDFFKGLYITPSNATQAPGEGAILYFDLIDPLTKLTLYYKNTSTLDTAEFSFEVSSSAARFNHFTHDYSSATTILNQLNNPGLGQDMIFLQSMAGLKATIQFPNIKDWVNKKGVGINSAELIIKAIPSFISDNYPAPTQLYLAGIDSLGNYFLPIDADEINGLGGTYNSSSQEYIFNISRYIQSLIDGKRTDFGFCLLTSSKITTLGRTILNGNRVVLGGGDNNPFQPKLKLTYTKLY